MNAKYRYVTALMLVCTAAPAASLFSPAEVSDTELAQLRGRYVLPDRIISFGVVMNSSWQASSGQVIGAQVSLNIAQGQSQPNLSISMIDQTGSAGGLSTGTGQVIGGAGLDSVQGVVQSVRTAGDFNTGRNDLSIDISYGAAPAGTGVGGSFSGPQSFSNGAGSVQVGAVNGGLQIALQAANGQGTSLQQIGGGSIAQQANIGGTLNEVRNLATLSVALRSPLNNLNLVSCLEQLKGLKQNGL
ncbi:hypothetical protein [Halopseudomonas maritima]|uniref:hypothetical protein n=1 Tax=Halopseudomonas maritima TaxID=2918528 RepID=UPI001EEAC0AD|nr:hypothetical protein [Halopseudomonas maritima]UJJ31975.1 hypothetical protein HV822_02055 [Halopseudomonas maritima]